MTKNTYTLDYSDQPIQTLDSAAVEELLSHQLTSVSVDHGDETVLDPDDPKSVSIARPRIHRSGDVTQVKFTTTIALPSIPED